MMNIQNPAPYPPQSTYSYGVGVSQPPSMQPSYPNDFAQNQYQQSGPFPTTPARSNQFTQAGAQVPAQVYQQLQQQQGFVRPQNQGNGLAPGQTQRQSPVHNQTPNPSRANPGQAVPNQSSNMAVIGQMQQPMVNPMAQQAQAQMAMARPMVNQAQSVPLSPQSASREKARVTILLEINAHLLHEVVSLQNQGKAGPVQQSPTSPNSQADNFNSSIDASKATPSKEYSECMRRLQANLSYLAALADAKKRPDGKIPPYPAIISPPMHLNDVRDLYKKLASLFPEASQSTTNKAIAFASAQQGQQAGTTQSQMQPPQAPNVM